MGMIIKKIFSISKRKKQHLNTSDKEKFKFFLRNFTTVYLSNIWTKIIEEIHILLRIFIVIYMITSKNLIYYAIFLPKLEEKKITN